MMQSIMLNPTESGNHSYESTRQGMVYCMRPSISVTVVEHFCRSQYPVTSHGMSESGLAGNMAWSQMTETRLHDLVQGRARRSIPKGTDDVGKGTDDVFGYYPNGRWVSTKQLRYKLHERLLVAGLIQDTISYPGHQHRHPRHRSSHQYYQCPMILVASAEVPEYGDECDVTTAVTSFHTGRVNSGKRNKSYNVFACDCVVGCDACEKKQCRGKLDVFVSARLDYEFIELGSVLERTTRLSGTNSMPSRVARGSQDTFEFVHYKRTTGARNRIKEYKAIASAVGCTYDGHHFKFVCPTKTFADATNWRRRKYATYAHWRNRIPTGRERHIPTGEPLCQADFRLALSLGPAFRNACVPECPKQRAQLLSHVYMGYHSPERPGGYRVLLGETGGNFVTGTHENRGRFDALFLLPSTCLCPKSSPALSFWRISCA